MNRIAMILLAPMIWLGCTDKPAPKSKTTVHTETTVQGQSGERTTTDTKQVDTVMPDGTKQTQHTETVTTKPPATQHVPSTPFLQPSP